MTIKQLHYFIAVAETLSFTQAARRFFVAQTAISQQIASLEKELGLLLFRRNNRHVELTKAGTLFYHEIRPLVIQLEQAIQTASAADRNIQREFRIGIAPDVPASILPSLLRQFHALCPALNINLQCEEEKQLARPLKEGDLDVVLLAGQSSLDQRLVAAIPLNNAAAPLFLLAVYPEHPLYHARELPWDALTGEGLILSRDVTAAPGFAELEPYVQRLAASCPSAHSADSIDGILTLVSAGLGLALIPAHAFRQVPPQLHLIRPVPCPETQAVTLYHHRNNSRPELADFIGLCRQLYA